MLVTDHGGWVDTEGREGSIVLVSCALSCVCCAEGTMLIPCGFTPALLSRLCGRKWWFGRLWSKQEGGGAAATGSQAQGQPKARQNTATPSYNPITTPKEDLGTRLHRIFISQRTTIPHHDNSQKAKKKKGKPTNYSSIGHHTLQSGEASSRDQHPPVRLHARRRPMSSHRQDHLGGLHPPPATLRLASTAKSENKSESKARGVMLVGSDNYRLSSAAEGLEPQISIPSYDDDVLPPSGDPSIITPHPSFTTPSPPLPSNPSKAVSQHTMQTPSEWLGCGLHLQEKSLLIELKKNRRLVGIFVYQITNSDVRLHLWETTVLQYISRSYQPED